MKWDETAITIQDNVKTQHFKTVFNGDTAYITQLKRQKSKINLWETYDTLRRNFRFFVYWAAGQKSYLVIRSGDPDFL